MVEYKYTRIDRIEKRFEVVLDQGVICSPSSIWVLPSRWWADGSSLCILNYYLPSIRVVIY